MISSGLIGTSSRRPCPARPGGRGAGRNRCPACAEFPAAGGKALVAAGRDAERVANGDRARGALPQVELGLAVREPVRLDLDRAPGIGAGEPDELTAVNQPAAKAARSAVARPSAPSVRSTAPVAVNAAWSRSMPHFASPRSAAQVAR